jgi:hypothetical protein
MKRAWALVIAILPLTIVPAQQSRRDQELFRRIFGAEVCRFDPAAVAKLKTLPPGTRLKLDTNGDGKIDTIYFIDTDPKNDPALGPIVVKAIDRDGDMDKDGGPDQDSDLYVADLHGDGTVDSVVEYIDRDHDNALDEMAIYSYSANNKNLGTDTIQVWWSRDVGHDHRLWETVNYRYQQKECQFRCDFNGDEIFSNYVFDSANNLWVPGWENPFAFYDEDGDKLAEVAIRFSGSGSQVESMRYSFDADNDATRANPHNYDFGFTCLTSRKDNDGRTLPVPPSLTERIRLQGIDAGPVLAWSKARAFGEHADWGRVLMAWVENDNNVDSHPGGDPHSRWEGVIASPTEHFAQVGGPPVGPYNTRYETDLDNSGHMKLYYSPFDRRIHLRGADEGWLKVDYDFDGKVDYQVRYEDTDKDGIIDTWSTDFDGDGVFDRDVHLRGKAEAVPLEYRVLSARYKSVVADALAQNAIAIPALKSALQHLEKNFRVDDAELFYRDKLSSYRSAEGVGQRIHDSREGTRFYQDVARDRYFARLRKALSGEPQKLRAVEQLYDEGQFEKMAARLRTTP